MGVDALLLDQVEDLLFGLFLGIGLIAAAEAVVVLRLVGVGCEVDVEVVPFEGVALTALLDFGCGQLASAVVATTIFAIEVVVLLGLEAE